MALAQLAYNGPYPDGHPGNCMDVAAANGLEVMRNAVQNFPKFVPMQFFMLELLENMALDANLRSRIASQGCIELIVTSMQTHSANVDLQIGSCQVLEKIIKDSDVNEMKLSSCAGIEAAVMAMRLHVNSAEMQRSGARLLSLVAGNPGNDMKLITIGGVDAMLKALTSFLTHSMLQFHCLEVLGIILERGHNTVKVYEGGGATLAIKAMTEHSARPEVNETACRLLQRLLSTVSILDAVSGIIAAGGLQAVLNALHNHASDSRTQVYALWCTALLCQNSKENRAVALQPEMQKGLGGTMRSDALAMTTTAMTTFKDEVLVQLYGSWVIQSLSVGNEASPPYQTPLGSLWQESLSCGWEEGWKSARRQSGLA
ncbi:hypothetical protein CYMTET_33115 [Cymbomonas tetramitiformis]|uniref:LRRK2 ARM repeat domain-containing protein n=1 Tax=Cymbomonas tetramitiformis TaxID=36881 RepID=A0AAE0FEE0_9CHLO|nr:hypothetical protein CYMTET_33115 [Cymbomonas tetramitiformis]